MYSILLVPFLIVVSYYGLDQTNSFFLTPYLLSIGVQSWMIGILMGIFRASGIVMILPSGILSDRLKIKNLVFLGTLLLILFYLGLQFFTQPIMLAFLFFLGGSGSSIVLTSATALFYKLLKKQDKAKKLAKLNVGRSMSHGILTITTGFLVSLFSFLFVFKLALVFVIPLFFLAYFLPSNETYDIPKTTYKQELKNKSALFLYLFYSLYMFHAGGDSVSAPMIWRNFLKFNDFQIGLLGGAAVLLIGSFGSYMVGGKMNVSGKWAKFFALFGLIFSAIGHITIALSGNFLAAFAGRLLHLLGDVTMDMFLIVELSFLFPKKSIGGHYSFSFLLSKLVSTVSFVVAGLYGQFFKPQYFLFTTAAIMLLSSIWLLFWDVNFERENRE